ncbi:hypothetical protein BVRB_3g063700 [Beta vulgaris subsp. vulgaris]|nr:hypothetical protein BVRB_3g063700 [Beta vulgaris subsp. vulgaris]
MADQKPSTPNNNNNNNNNSNTTTTTNNKNTSDSGKPPSIRATIDDVVETRKSKRRKNCPSFSLLQLNKIIDGQSNSSFNFSFPTDELTTTTPETTPKFGSFNSGHGSSEMVVLVKFR